VSADASASPDGLVAEMRVCAVVIAVSGCMRAPRMSNRAGLRGRAPSGRML
jgi:hypothetical protein